MMIKICCSKAKEKSSLTKRLKYCPHFIPMNVKEKIGFRGNFVGKSKLNMGLFLHCSKLELEISVDEHLIDLFLEEKISVLVGSAAITRKRSKNKS